MKNVRKSFQEYVDVTISSLSLKDKIALCSGKNEWDTKEIRNAEGKVMVPSVKVADGPHGLRKTIGQGDNLGLAGSEPATCFPAESLIACSFDQNLAVKMGKAIAEEARASGVCTVLGPGANIKRNPLCGRNFEYFSEDPYLTGRMASSYIKGLQSRGIGTSLKHFACNSQEYFRMLSDSKVDERTLREIYLAGFEYAIKEAKPATVMCAYNKINGISCSDNKFLLDTILRKEWGYKGLVVSDWGALNNRIKAFQAGCDLIMPGGSGFEEKDAEAAVKGGILKEEDIDRCAKRVAAFAIRQHILLKDKSGAFAQTFMTREELYENAHNISRKIAEESAVLLKNEDQMLPLDSRKDRVCIIGSMAEAFRFQGSGSSKINAAKTEDFRSCFQKETGKILYSKGYDKDGKTNRRMIDEAVALAKSTEKVVLFAGLPEQYEAEGIDRRSMKLPDGENELIEAIARVNENIILVLICGCVVEIPWENQVKSILWMGLSGQAGPAALTRILTGAVNPSGKLAETWPVRYEDCPSAKWYLKDRDAEYREGIYVGYRYYDKANVPVRYPFGHGLSYTSFSYDGMEVIPKKAGYRIQISVTNTGDRSGKEAVLLFISPLDGVIQRPIRELKGFVKVELQPGETKTVSFETDERTFAVWNNGWKTYEGKYRLEIGDCNRTITISGLKPDEKEQEEQYSTQLQSDGQISDKFNEKYNVNSTISEVIEDVLLLKIIYKFFEKKQAKTFGRDSAEYLAAMSSANECPLRAVQNLLGVKNHFAQAVADFGNKHYLTGIRHLLK